ncbi:MAG: TlpA family protein disulfide reductase [Acidimicrobiales bacterium]
MPASSTTRTLWWRLVAGVFVLVLVAAACGGTDDTTPEISLGADTGGAAQTGSSGAEADGLIPPTSSADVFTAEFADFDGGTQSLAGTAEGKPVVLNFFASWCPNCVAEMPDFEVVNQELAGEVQLVGLATQDAPSDAQGLIETTGVTYPLGLDPAGDFFNVFEGLGMPTTAFLTAEGEVAHVFTGQLDTDGLTEKINEFLL